VQHYVTKASPEALQKGLKQAALAIRASTWIWPGIRTIKFLEGIGAPFMLAIGVLLLMWVTRKASGFGPVLSAPSRFRDSAAFWRFFVPALTGMVGFWATVALNIPEFSRYARSQRAQMLGQALGLPTAMTLYSFIGVAVTSASVVIFGEAIWDPVVLLGRFHQPAVAFVALIALLLATLNTNVAANVVSPSNDFSNLNPRRVSFRTGGLITGVPGSGDDAVEAIGRLQRLHLRLAGGLFGAAGTDCRHYDRGLLPGARAEAGGRGSISARPQL
jgi:NCS1 nucleoside transporter family